MNTGNSTNKLRITDWAEEDRPREKMLLQGTQALSDAELIAILIGSGNANETAVELSRRILNRAKNNLSQLGKLSVKELISEFKGIGTAKAVTIAAAMELGKRRMLAEQPAREKINSSSKAYQLFYPLLCDLPHEELWIALLNRSCHVIGKVKISQGGVNETSADIKLILKEAVCSLASAVVLCHNHPSGNTTPSQQDIVLTHKLHKGSAWMDIVLTDHIILCDGSYYSFADEGTLAP